jgi:hypothetical protein
MQYPAILKSVLPFFLTFTAGLFVASFFVSIAAPKFDRISPRSEYKRGKCDHMKRQMFELRSENERLIRENEALAERIGLDGSSISAPLPPLDVPAPPAAFERKLEASNPVPPLPPMPPVREMKMKTVTVK